MSKGRNMTLCRFGAYLKQKEAAERLGIPQSDLNDYEWGRKDPSLDVLVAMANLYRVGLGSLRD